MVDAVKKYAGVTGMKLRLWSRQENLQKSIILSLKRDIKKVIS